MDRDDRRDFLKTAGVLAVGALTASVARANEDTSPTVALSDATSSTTGTQLLPEGLARPDVEILCQIQSCIKGVPRPVNNANFTLTTPSLNAIRSYASITSNVKLPPSSGVVESTYSRPELAPWVRPFHFEQNLNSALDALDDSESLLNEIRQLSLIKIQVNHSEATIPAADHQAKENHETTVPDLALSDYKANLELRLTERIIDLIEYTKAARFGAKRLFGIESNDSLYDNNTNVAVSTFRKSLRLLLQSYRGFVARDQELVIPISLRHAKVEGGNFLVSRWKLGTDAEDRPNDALGVDEFVIDLSTHKTMVELSLKEKNPRLRRFGIQVMDTTVGKPADPAPITPNFFSLSIEDAGGGIRLGPSADVNKFLIDVVRFDSVAGSWATPVIDWSSYDKLINLDPLRRWKVKISETSHNGTQVKGPVVRDIILHVHVAVLT